MKRVVTIATSGLLLALALCCPELAMSGSAKRGWVHPFDLPQPDDAPRRLLALVEIPAGAQAKYEIDPRHGGLVVDRLLSEGFFYPAHYGGLPSLNAADGDLMDVLIITPVALVPGALIEVVPIGLARMLDGGERDDKVLAVPFNAVSGSALSLSSIDQDVLKAIEQFFRTYKAKPNEPNPIDWQGYVDHEAFMVWWRQHTAQSIPSDQGTGP